MIRSNPNAFDGLLDAAVVTLQSASVTSNAAQLAVNDAGALRLPAEIATEAVENDVPTGDDTYLFYASLYFNGTTLTGIPASPDIGVYQYFSVPFSGTLIYTPQSLSKDALVQP
jgi:hypothetical protein